MSFRRVVFGVILVLLGMGLGMHLVLTNLKTTKWWLTYLGCTQNWCTQTDSTQHPYDQSFEENAYWLALNMYYHRGGTNTDEGRKAVTAVVLNRMIDKNHFFGPRTVKGVITFGYVPGCRSCALSWYCDGKDDNPDDLVRFKRDLSLARKWLKQYYKGTFEDPTQGATWFHYHESEFPKGWPIDLEPTGLFGEYMSYRYPGSR